LIKNHGNIYALINNAAIAADGVITLMPHPTINNLLKTNLEAVLYLTQICVNQMLLQKSSVIINISSIIGNRGYSGLSVYSATKAGLDGITRSLARELGPKNIRVNSVAPGYLETEMSKGLSMLQRDQIIRRTPLGRLGTLEDITGLIRFLLSDEAQFINGQVITVDGGLNC
jgi:3-oxoacyl-[acyl-carrier protein] reductase